jgi:flagellar motility protein MotE (MotC chaperone)
MSIPRILPLVGVAIGGVLAINALSGARALPDLMSGAKAFAEEAAKPVKGDKKAKADAAGDPGEAKAADQSGKDASASSALPAPSVKPPPVCAPTAAELAKEAGLSPAELQVLQSLGARRGQLDDREQQMDVQLALLTAAETKLDAKIKALNGLKGDIKGLLADTDSKEQAEIDRLVKVFEAMKAKDAAPRMVLLDDSVRLPIAAKMKERVLSAIIAQMPPPEAKKLTESLARRYGPARTLAQNAAAVADPSLAPPAAAAPKQAADAGVDGAAKPERKAAPAKRAAAKKKPAAQAANAKSDAKPDAKASAAPAAGAPAPAAAAPAPKAG